MWRKLLFFGLLYFVQGAALAFIVNFQKPFLNGHGVSKEAIGLFTSLLLLPFILKVGLGYISDRFPLGRWGARKPYMAIGLILFSVCFCSLSFIDPGVNFPLYAVMMWLASLGLAWFDTCADGLACDVAKSEEQSAIQAAMVTGKSLGITLMSLGFGYLALRHGFRYVFLAIALFGILVLLAVLSVRFRRIGSVHEIVHSWRDVLSRPFLLFGLFGAVYSIASFGTDGLVTLHFSETMRANSLDVGIFGMYKGVGAIGGAIAFALLRWQMGMQRAHMLTLLFLAVGCFLPLTPIAGGLAGPLWGFCWGMGETAFVTLAMVYAVGHWAATIFALSMIFSNLGTSVGEAMGAPLVPQIGYDGVFILFSLIAVLSLGIVWRVYQTLAKR